MSEHDDIVIRLATPDDAAVITHQRRAMFVDMDDPDPADLDVMDAAFLPYVQRQLAQGAYLGWLACTREGCVVAGGGLLVYEWPVRPGDPQPCRAYILNVYTEPAYRQRGIARRLLETMLAWCRAHGFKTVTLHASHAGRQLYQSLGFVPTNEMRITL